jgi:hypothetical protein
MEEKEVLYISAEKCFTFFKKSVLYFSRKVFYISPECYNLNCYISEEMYLVLLQLNGLQFRVLIINVFLLFLFFTGLLGSIPKDFISDSRMTRFSLTSVAQ